MYRIIILILLCSSFFKVSSADEFVVKDFKLDIADLSARKAEKKDFNGDVCAIIKILTDIPGLKFEANISITAQEFKNNAYRLFVSPTERKLTIMKDGFINLEYVLPLKIESNNVYVMILTKQSAEAIENVNNTGFVFFKTDPEKADVSINGEYKGKTPFQMELKAGNYTYALSKPLYYSSNGSFEITANQTNKKEISLVKNFGSVIINSQPEGAEIEIDQKTSNAFTPHAIDQLASGKYTLRLSKELYEPKTLPFTIKDGEPTKLNVTLTPIFGVVNITANNNAEIYIDGVYKERGSYYAQLVKGIHTIEVKKDKYISQTQKLDVQTNKTESINFNLKARLGLLSVMTTNPAEAKIFIDDTPYGSTPAIIKDLLVGSHTLKLEKEGFETLTKYIEIKENEKISEQLELKIYKKPNYTTYKQETYTQPSTSKHKYNWLLKWNAYHAGNSLIFGIEKRLFKSNYWSLSLEGGVYTDVFTEDADQAVFFSNTTAFDSTISGKGNGFIINPELRLYLGSKNMNGFYLVASTRFSQKNVLGYYLDPKSNDTFTYNATIREYLPAALLGLQIGKLIGIDASAGIAQNITKRTADHIAGINANFINYYVPFNLRLFLKF